MADLRTAGPWTGRERLATRVGLAAMAVCVVLPIVVGAMSHGTPNPLAQRAALVLAVLGVAVAVAGGALYLKSALATFLRFWLVRDLHERRAQTDRLLAARGSTGDRTGGVEGT